ncbi:MAG: polyphosphate kinase 2 family protein [Planctomycetes bacterium]|nr:polyphosphate kinase 2 family protein [Planctomycetota bacterium]
MRLSRCGNGPRHAWIAVLIWRDGGLSLGLHPLFCHSGEVPRVKTIEDLISACRVPPGKKIALKEYDPSWAGDKKIPKADRKATAKELLTEKVDALASAQELLYASDTYSVLIVLQAMDAAGKDGTIKHVMSGVNPQGCEVASFKHPSAEELDHNFLWRYSRFLPERGRIGIFNRSYYEEVLVVKVHPKLVTAQRIPAAKPNKEFWQARYEDINAFERHLIRNGTKIFKFFLNLSKEEQRKRFLERLDNPDKHWKFSPADLKERQYWDQYTNAYEDCLSATSSKDAPWHVIPADHKWVSRALVAAIISRGINSLGLTAPKVDDAKRKLLAEARKELEAEEE